MSKEAQVKQLEILRAEIETTFTDAWLFPTRGLVQGFLGNGPVMFVAERPSTASFNNKPAILLYSLLEKHGVSDAHLTDVIKTRGKGGQPYPEDMAPHRHIFDREVEIVKPSIMIALGQKVYDLLQFSFAGSGIKVKPVWHFSATRYGSAKADTFDQQIKEALA